MYISQRFAHHLMYEKTLKLKRYLCWEFRRNCANESP